MSDLTNAEKREIWNECVAFAFVRGRTTPDELQKEALRRYPDPYEPTIVTDDHGTQYRIAQDGHVQVRNSADPSWCTISWLTPSLMASLGEIAQEYSERTK